MRVFFVFHIALLDSLTIFAFRLMLDEDNQYDLSQTRCTKWVAQLKKEGFM